jgi:hypothetical protein
MTIPNFSPTPEDGEKSGVLGKIDSISVNCNLLSHNSQLFQNLTVLDIGASVKASATSAKE